MAMIALNTIVLMMKVREWRPEALGQANLGESSLTEQLTIHPRHPTFPCEGPYLLFRHGFSFDLLSFNTPASESLGQNTVKHSSCPVVPKTNGCDGDELQTRAGMHGDVGGHRVLMECGQRFDLV